MVPYERLHWNIFDLLKLIVVVILIVAEFVPSLSMAAVAAGADGLIIEVHNNPSKAKCDGAQSLMPADFDQLANKLRSLKKFI